MDHYWFTSKRIQNLQKRITNFTSFDILSSCACRKFVKKGEKIQLPTAQPHLPANNNKIQLNLLTNHFYSARERKYALWHFIYMFDATVVAGFFFSTRMDHMFHGLVISGWRPPALPFRNILRRQHAAHVFFLARSREFNFWSPQTILGLWLKIKQACHIIYQRFVLLRCWLIWKIGTVFFRTLLPIPQKKRKKRR